MRLFVLQTFSSHMKQARRTDIDMARAIAIVLVVLGHYYPDGSPAWYTGLRDWAYSFHMPLFMYLSGYVYILAKREESYLSFIGRKARRLLVPYVIVSAVIILIKLLSQSLLGMDIKNPVGFDAVWKVLTGPYAAIHLWFIFAIWWMFMILPFFKSRTSRFCLFLASLVLHYLPESVSVAYPTIFCLDQFCIHFVYFMLGVVISDSGFRLQDLGMAACAAAVLLFAVNSVFHPLPAVDAYVGILGMMALTGLLSRLPSKCQTPLLAVSDSSYMIYLTHSIFIGFAATALKAVPQLCDTQSSLFGLGAAAVVAVSVICSMLVHRALEYLRRRISVPGK